MPPMLTRRSLLGIGIGTAATAIGATNVLTADRASAAENADENDDAPARLRVSHVSPDAPNVDIRIDGDPAITDLAFRTVSDYRSLAAGSYSVTITAAGEPDTVVFEDEIELEAGTDYTVAAIGELSEETFEAEVLVDRNRELPDAVAELRVVHASPDAPAVDIATDHDRHLASDLSFGDIGHYRVFFAGETKVAVTAADADEDADPVFETRLALEGGTTYTVFAAGYLTPDDEPTDEAFSLLPAAGGPRPETARVRGAHAVPDAPNVDVFIDDEKVFSTVHFGDVTEFRSLSAGTYQVAVTAAGDPDTVVFEGEVPLEAGTDYTVAAIGELSEETVQPAILTHAGDIDADTAGLRVLHASPDAPAVDVTTAEGDTTLVDGLSFGNATALAGIDPGSYTLEVRPASQGDDNPFDAEFEVDLSAGRSYTLIATGYFTAGDEPAKPQFTVVPAVTDTSE